MKPDPHNDGVNHESGSNALFDHPLLKRISDLAASVASTRLLVLSPCNAGWKEVRLQSQVNMPEFCRTIQSSKEGARHCRMCHVLMTVAACTEGLTEQQCHAGARVLLAPAFHGSSGSLAVLSSCVYNSSKALKTVLDRARKLGIATDQIEKAYRSLPSPSPQENDALRRILDVCAAAASEIEDNARLTAENRRLAETRGRVPPMADNIEARLRMGAQRDRADAPPRAQVSSSSALVRVLTQIIDERPHLPFTEKELAVAARITPNHLSLLFRRHTGRCFSDYLTDRRIELAKRLLGDLTLSIGEVARRTGYDDPGYFARRFRSRTGMTPRRWRETGSRR